MSFIRDYLIAMKEKFDLEKNTVEQIRREWTAVAIKAELPSGTTVDRVMVNNLPAEWVAAANVPIGNEQVILYFHGGGFYSGSCDTYRALAASISAASAVRVLVVEYRLAPEHKYPSANDDAISAYSWLIESGILPKNIVIGGDSAGGGLTLMTLLSLRDAGYQLPAAAFMLSPWADLIYFDGESYVSRAELDPLCSLSGCKLSADYYIETAAIKPPILSPINQNLGGLPSLLIQVGDHEVLLNDSTRLAARAQEAGVDVTLKVWDNMWHVFHAFAAIVPEAQQAINTIGKFVQKHVG
ncbi:Monoterpene epsilon-lactone hydrolase [Sporomusa ovata DSM 2662]|uniref:6-hexanolactone hydrolase n=1 Tax=Sporomusa ovata TaxID=2378 RepID=A0A0U1L5F8_9FIRM|nr:alpha/beta hydrolase [Sporomusa ovata]EQB28590.1 acetyl-hydrolase [Sporomusa ovata DSM 2662]CQR74922.1 6-hexanolactone hydrolase [Sporomusa ovata]